MATIAIVGPGAVGGVSAGWLTQRGGHALTREREGEHGLAIGESDGGR